jgi:quinone-modifying oxidoreductase, subunit QmoA
MLTVQGSIRNTKHYTLNPVLIIGAGISGVTTAVELAEAGKEVILIEKESYLGGNVIRMHNYFPKLCPPACGMEINFRRIKNKHRIKVMTQTEVLDISGEKGAFKVKLKTEAALVNDLCTACGECTDACPVQRPDAFNYNFGLTKTIYLPHPLAYPQKYVIDEVMCEGEACGKCVSACQYGAIDLTAKALEQEIEVHSIVGATGWMNYDASLISGLNYDKSLDIVTNVEFERLLSVTGPGEGKLLRPSDNKPPKSIAFVQCAGSRDDNYLPYCSSVCCSASLKHALNVAEMLPETKVSIFYIDLRVTGRNEDFLRKVEETKNIELMKGKVARVDIDPETNFLLVEAENIEKGQKKKMLMDMVVLATGIVPANGIRGLNTNEDNFLTIDQDKGIYIAGCAKKPMDVSMSVKDGTSAALKAISR